VPTPSLSFFTAIATIGRRRAAVGTEVRTGTRQARALAYHDLGEATEGGPLVEEDGLVQLLGQLRESRAQTHTRTHAQADSSQIEGRVGA
jgi:hypothetical protein